MFFIFDLGYDFVKVVIEGDILVVFILGVSVGIIVFIVLGLVL